MIHNLLRLDDEETVGLTTSEKRRENGDEGIHHGDCGVNPPKP